MVGAGPCYRRVCRSRAGDLLEERVVPGEGAQQHQGRLLLRRVTAETERPLRVLVGQHEREVLHGCAMERGGA